MIELIVYPTPDNPKLINNSPFCAKTEILLKLAKIEHKVTNFTGNPAKFKNAKLPVIKYQNKQICDSSLIHQFLCKEFGLDLDCKLTASERAQGYAFSKMAEEFLYWSLLHERWMIDSNWESMREVYFGHLPKLIKGFLSNMVRKSVAKSSFGHGMGRHSDKEILQFGKDSIQAISDFLGEKDFFLGNSVSSYDTSIYAFVASLLHSTFGPELKKEAQSKENLVNYDKRMFNLVF